MTRFGEIYEKNKNKWARQDCRTARYSYRMQYNIPRVSIERTEDLTEYEFEYELLLRNEYQEFLKDLRAGDPIDISQGSLDKEIRTDPDIYESLKKKAETGEFIDFKLPDDSHLPRLSTMRRSKEEQQKLPDDFEPVKPEEIFGRVFGGVK